MLCRECQRVGKQAGDTKSMTLRWARTVGEQHQWAVCSRGLLLICIYFKPSTYYWSDAYYKPPVVLLSTSVFFLLIVKEVTHGGKCTKCMLQNITQATLLLGTLYRAPRAHLHSD